MGYTSEIVIAISLDVIAHDLIDPIIPDCIKEEEFEDLFEDDDKKDTLTQRRYHLEEWKFYPTYPDVQEILTWFEKMDELNLDYGALRLGEDFGDVETWGDPAYYGISAAQTIVY